MDSICVRCARLALRSPKVVGIPATSIARAFSITSTRPAGMEVKSSIQPPTDSSESSNSLPASPEGRPPATLTRKPVLARTARPNNPNQRPQGSQPTPGGQLLRRNNAPQGLLIRRTGGPPQSGQVLRRTGDQPARPGQFVRRGAGPRQPGAPGATNQQQNIKKRRRPNERSRAAYDDADAPTEVELDEYIAKNIDPPVNPTEAIEYHPTPQSALDLQKDWPDTPLSSTGLTASVVQKIEFLARRIPHSYQTPGQLAEHFHKGNLTRFESEEEKQQVLKLAQELAERRADQLSQRKGEKIAPLDMTLDDLSKSKGDKQLLVDGMVRGGFGGEPEKQRMPFLDSIVRNLRNNETYGKNEMDQFMARVQSMMPAQNPNRKPAQNARK